MSTVNDIPKDVHRYVVEHIDSVPELETLLLVYDNSEQIWSPADVARRIYASQAMATALLTKLAQDGLCSELGEGEAKRYQYRPRADLSQLIDRLAQTYRHALIPMTKLIHAKPKASLLQFADAFRMGKDQ